MEKHFSHGSLLFEGHGFCFCFLLKMTSEPNMYITPFLRGHEPRCTSAAQTINPVAVRLSRVTFRALQLLAAGHVLKTSHFLPYHMCVVYVQIQKKYTQYHSSFIVHISGIISIISYIHISIYIYILYPLN